MSHRFELILGVLLCLWWTGLCEESACVGEEQVSEWKEKLASLEEAKEACLAERSTLQQELMQLSKTLDDFRDESTNKLRDSVDKLGEVSKELDLKKSEVEKMHQSMELHKKQMMEKDQELKQIKEESQIQLKHLEQLKTEKSSSSNNDEGNEIAMLRAQLAQLQAQMNASTGWNMTWVTTAWDQLQHELRNGTSKDKIIHWWIETSGRMQEMYQTHGEPAMAPWIAKMTDFYQTHCRERVEPWIEQTKPHAEKYWPMVLEAKALTIELADHLYSRMQLGRALAIQRLIQADIPIETATLGVNIAIGIVLAPILVFLIPRFVSWCLYCLFCCGCCGLVGRRSKPSKRTKTKRD